MIADRVVEVTTNPIFGCRGGTIVRVGVAYVVYVAIMAFSVLCLAENPLPTNGRKTLLEQGTR